MVRSRPRGPALALVCGLGIGSAGCEQLAGIEVARLDPALAGDPSPDAGDPSPDAGDPCLEYCATVMANCTGDFAVYQDLGACQAVCPHLPFGSAGDALGNSVECRLENARLAGQSGEPSVYCPAAAPGGFGICGSNCEGYCVLMQQICSVRFQQTYASLDDCNLQCDALPAAGAFDLHPPSGDSVNCRLSQVSAAALDPEAYCGRAAGEPPCAA